MPTLNNARDLIDTLLAALGDGAELGDGVLLRVRPGTTIVVGRTAGPPPRAVLTFDPPPEVSARRGVFPLRCTLTAVTVGADEVRLAIDGWFDRRWRVES